MGKRTLVSCWKQYERLTITLLNGSGTKPRAKGMPKPKTKKEVLAELKELTDKANQDKIGDALTTLFVRPYIPQGLEVGFNADCKRGAIPQWQTEVDGDHGKILVHPPAILKFIHTIRQITSEHIEREEELVNLRHLSFLSEVAKLPNIYILFLLVLQRIALLMEIAHLEKRGGVVEIADGEAYHTLLWAFKELEMFLTKTYGVNMRAQYGISWYEGDWITGT